ncbi:MAG: hypothetical protein V5A16_00570 [Haloplanus sp.]
MRRRRILALLATPPFTGCTGDPGDQITSLVVNRTDAPHTVAVRVDRDGRTVIENTVDVASEGVAELGTAPWRRGRYRVTARVDSVEPRSTGSRTQSGDGEPALSETFRSTEWFNQLDVVIEADGSVELNRGRAA